MNTTTHNCRAEPHCICNHNAWYHEDGYEQDPPQPCPCGAEGCDCQDYTRCYEYVRPYRAQQTQLGVVLLCRQCGLEWPSCGHYGVSAR